MPLSDGGWRDNGTTTCGGRLSWRMRRANPRSSKEAIRRCGSWSDAGRRRNQDRPPIPSAIGSAEVNELLATGSRQTVHDRLKAGTLLGILDQGKWRFPLWQFDAEGPNGVIDGLAQVLQALQVSNLAKARWLQKPHPVFGGSTPVDLLRQVASKTSWLKQARWVVVRIDPPLPAGPHLR